MNTKDGVPVGEGEQIKLWTGGYIDVADSCYQPPRQIEGVVTKHWVNSHYIPALFYSEKQAIQNFRVSLNRHVEYLESLVDEANELDTELVNRYNRL